MMGNMIGGCNQDIVHVDYYFSCRGKVPEYGVHHGLEGAWGVGQTKEHDAGFVEPEVCLECSLLLVSFLYSHVVVTPTNIEFRKQFGITKSINEFGDQW